MKPRLSVSKTARGRFRYSESELKGTETPIFAYFRRSTKKAEQALSLENQADDIDLIIKENGFDKNKVHFFSESRSAYEGIKVKNGEVMRKRAEFTRMLHEMDSKKQPCIILVKDSSRLSRNKKDNEEVTKRLFGEYGNRKVIQKIIFGNGTCWDIHSDIKAVDNELLRNYHSSVDTSEKGMITAKGQLSRGIYSRKTPQGLSYWKSGTTILGLRQNERMPIIRKAFEMKQAGMTHKKIARYLKDHGINTGERDLNDRYFSNPIYIGEYIFTDKRTGEEIHYKNLKFYEKKTPISMTLWQGVQANKGKKNDNYGDKQVNYPLGEVLRTEKGRRLSGYIQKGTNQYTNNTEGIRVSEKWIINKYITFLKENIYKLILRKRFHSRYESEIVESILTNNEFSVGSLKVRAQSKLDTAKLNGQNSHWGNFFHSTAHGDYIRMTFLAQDFASYQEVFGGKKKKDWEKFVHMVSDQKKITNTIISFYEEVFDFINNTIVDFETILEGLSSGSKKEHSHVIQDHHTMKQEKTDRLKKEIGFIEAEVKTLKKNFLKIGANDGMEEIFKEELTALEQQKRTVEEKLLELEDETDFDLLISKLPNVLKKTFELSRKVLLDEENEELKYDIYDLIKLTTFELKIKKKKALEIELFGPVKQVLFGGDAVLEAPAGVEPASRALQAPVGPFYQGAK